MRKLEVRLDWGDEQVLVGTLAEQELRIYFEYDAAFLDAPVPIFPFKLPVRPGLFEHAERDFADVFGVFNDSLPDGWGLLLMDREFKKRRLDPATVSVLDRLAYIGTRGMGALNYHPPTATAEAEGFDRNVPDDAPRIALFEIEVGRHGERSLQRRARGVVVFTERGGQNAWLDLSGGWVDVVRGGEDPPGPVA